ncbi:hypothetical protein QOT17_001757 [Balamuthia mandrillaris]
MQSTRSSEQSHNNPTQLQKMDQQSKQPQSSANNHNGGVVVRGRSSSISHPGLTFAEEQQQAQHRNNNPLSLTTDATSPKRDKRKSKLGLLLERSKRDARKKRGETLKPEMLSTATSTPSQEHLLEEEEEKGGGGRRSGSSSFRSRRVSSFDDLVTLGAESSSSTSSGWRETSSSNSSPASSSPRQLTQKPIQTSSTSRSAETFWPKEKKEKAMDEATEQKEKEEKREKEGEKGEEEGEEEEQEHNKGAHPPEQTKVSSLAKIGHSLLSTSMLPFLGIGEVSNSLSKTVKHGFREKEREGPPDERELRRRSARFLWSSWKFRPSSTESNNPRDRTMPIAKSHGSFFQSEDESGLTAVPSSSSNTPIPSSSLSTSTTSASSSSSHQHQHPVGSSNGGGGGSVVVMSDSGDEEEKAANAEKTKKKKKTIAGMPILLPKSPNLSALWSPFEGAEKKRERRRNLTLSGGTTAKPKGATQQGAATTQQQPRNSAPSPDSLLPVMEDEDGSNSCASASGSGSENDFSESRQKRAIRRKDPSRSIGTVEELEEEVVKDGEGNFKESMKVRELEKKLEETKAILQLEMEMRARAERYLQEMQKGGNGDVEVKKMKLSLLSSSSSQADDDEKKEKQKEDVNKTERGKSVADLCGFDLENVDLSLLGLPEGDHAKKPIASNVKQQQQQRAFILPAIPSVSRSQRKEEDEEEEDDDEEEPSGMVMEAESESEAEMSKIRPKREPRPPSVMFSRKLHISFDDFGGVLEDIRRKRNNGNFPLSSRGDKNATEEERRTSHSASASPSHMAATTSIRREDRGGRREEEEEKEAGSESGSGTIQRLSVVVQEGEGEEGEGEAEEQSEASIDENRRKSSFVKVANELAGGEGSSDDDDGDDDDEDWVCVEELAQ